MNKIKKILSFRKKLGYTLIEILVVVGIIAILVALGTVSYATAQKKARDAKRVSDLSSIQNALEQYYSICGFVYPITSDGTDLPKDMITSVACDSPSQNIMTTVPTDPLGDPYEIIAADSSGSTYTICPPVVRTVTVEGNDINYRKEANTDCTDVNNTCCVSELQ